MTRGLQATLSPLPTSGGVTLDHLVAGLEARSGDLVHTKLLMVRLVSAGHRGVGGEGVVDPGVGHQVGLELVQVHIESSIKPDKKMSE